MSSKICPAESTKLYILNIIQVQLPRGLKNSALSKILYHYWISPLTKKIIT